MDSKMADKTIAFIGGGRIAWLMIKRLKDLNEFCGKIIVSDPDNMRLQKIESLNYSRLLTTADNHIAAGADLVFLAVHRPVSKEVLSDIKDHLNKKCVIVSLLPTLTCSYLGRETGGVKRIIRMIPNAPSMIGEGYNPVFFTDTFTIKEKQEIMWLFSQWGTSPEVKEKDLEAYALLSGMGPTYFWFQWLELKRLAIQFGLAPAAASEAVQKMVAASDELLFESGLTGEEVLDLVPVHPLKDEEQQIRDIFNTKLTAMFNKLSGMTE